MKITIEISDADARDIRRVIELANIHGTLSFETLARMLIKDVALVVRRPGCWEASNMAQVLASHGYDI